VKAKIFVIFCYFCYPAKAKIFAIFVIFCFTVKANIFAIFVIFCFTVLGAIIFAIFALRLKQKSLLFLLFLFYSA